MAVGLGIVFVLVGGRCARCRVAAWSSKRHTAAAAGRRPAGRCAPSYRRAGAGGAGRRTAAGGATHRGRPAGCRRVTARRMSAPAAEPAARTDGPGPGGLGLPAADRTRRGHRDPGGTGRCGVPRARAPGGGVALDRPARAPRGQRAAVVPGPRAACRRRRRRGRRAPAAARRRWPLTVAGISTAPTPWRYGPGVALAAVGTLGFGAVLGPEAPLIALGSVVGSLLTLVVRLDERRAAVMTTAGCSRPISALFGWPAGRRMLLVEGGLGMGTALIPVLLPGLVAAAVGYVLFLGSATGAASAPPARRPGPAGVRAHPRHRPRHRDRHRIVTAVVIAAIRRLGGTVDALRTSPDAGAVLVAFGLAVGLLALAARGLRAARRTCSSPASRRSRPWSGSRR